MTSENNSSEFIYREKDKIFVLEDLIFKDINDYFLDYDNSIIIE